MQAVLFESFGEPTDVLQVRQLPVPDPPVGKLRVRLLASPVNPSDLLVIQGKYPKLPQLPATPGFEGVGVVDAAGPGLFGKVLLGRRVVVPNTESGNWQEYTIVPARQVIPISSRLPLEQAATFFVNPATAFVMTRLVLRVPREAWLLQTAAASTLGKMVIRLGRYYGFRTVNVVRREEQVDSLKSLGADAVIVSDGNDLKNQLEAVTGRQDIRYAIDPVGGALAAAVARCLAPGGRLLLYGTLSGEPISLSPRDLMTPCAAIEGFWLGGWIPRLRLLAKIRLFRAIGKLIHQGVLTSQIAQTFSLEQIAEAVALAQEPGRVGKVLLRPGEP